MILYVGKVDDPSDLLLNQLCNLLPHHSASIVQEEDFNFTPAGSSVVIMSPSDENNINEAALIQIMCSDKYTTVIFEGDQKELNTVIAEFGLKLHSKSEFVQIELPPHDEPIYSPSGKKGTKTNNLELDVSYLDGSDPRVGPLSRKHKDGRYTSIEELGGTASEVIADLKKKLPDYAVDDFDGDSRLISVKGRKSQKGGSEVDPCEILMEINAQDGLLRILFSGRRKDAQRLIQDYLLHLASNEAGIAKPLNYADADNTWNKSNWMELKTKEELGLTSDIVIDAIRRKLDMNAVQAFLNNKKGVAGYDPDYLNIKSNVNGLVKYFQLKMQMNLLDKPLRIFYEGSKADVDWLISEFNLVPSESSRNNNYTILPDVGIIEDFEVSPSTTKIVKKTRDVNSASIMHRSKLSASSINQENLFVSENCQVISNNMNPKLKDNSQDMIAYGQTEVVASSAANVDISNELIKMISEAPNAVMKQFGSDPLIYGI